MQMRLNLPADPANLSTRQMEFIEKLKTIEAEKQKAKLEKTMGDEYRIAMYIGMMISAILIIVTISCHIYFYSKEVAIGKRTAEYMKLGYEQQTIPGYTFPVWRKPNEPRQDSGDVREGR